MEGAPKRQVNAEQMLAELKRALESSSNAPTPSASPATKSSSPGGGIRRSQIDKGSDYPAQAKASKPVGPQTELQKAARPRTPSWRLTAGGLALAGAATISVSFALMNKAPTPVEREPSVAATEGRVRPQNEQALAPSSSPRASLQESPRAAPSQAGALETRPEADAAPATGGSLPALGNAEGDAPHLSASSLESASPAFAPVLLDQAPALAPSVRIGPDGAPIATAPPSPASTDSGRQAEAPKPAAPAASQKVKPDEPPRATTPSIPASTASAPPAETPSRAAAPPASQKAKPDGTRIATAPPAHASTESAPPAETSEPNATPTAHVSNEPAQPSIRKADSKKKALEKAAPQKPLRTPAPPVKSIAQAERQSTEPARPKEAEKSPEPTQGAGNPAQVAPVAAPSVPQRVADGVTHAFGYLMHLPGALVPHLGGANSDVH